MDFRSQTPWIICVIYIYNLQKYAKVYMCHLLLSHGDPFLAYNGKSSICQGENSLEDSPVSKLSYWQTWTLPFSSFKMWLTIK